MNNFNQLMKQAQQMQAKLLEAQNKMNEIEITGTSGGGMVVIILSGKGEMRKLSIDHKLLSPNEADILADLVVAAHNDARSKLQSKLTEQMSGVLPLGMKMPF